MVQNKGHSLVRAFANSKPILHVPRENWYLTLTSCLHILCDLYGERYRPITHIGLSEKTSAGFLVCPLSSCKSVSTLTCVAGKAPSPSFYLPRLTHLPVSRSQCRSGPHWRPRKANSISVLSWVMFQGACHPQNWLPAHHCSQ